MSFPVPSRTATSPGVTLCHAALSHGVSLDVTSYRFLSRRVACRTARYPLRVTRLRTLYAVLVYTNILISFLNRKCQRTRAPTAKQIYPPTTTTHPPRTNPTGEVSTPSPTPSRLAHAQGYKHGCKTAGCAAVGLCACSAEGRPTAPISAVPVTSNLNIAPSGTISDSLTLNAKKDVDGTEKVSAVEAAGMAAGKGEGLPAAGGAGGGREAGGAAPPPSSETSAVTT